MTQPAAQIRSGSIYQDVFTKRIDNAPVTVMAELECAQIVDGRLHFADHDRAIHALRDGVFLLERPAGLNLEAGDEFAKQFHLGPEVTPYGKFRDVTSAMLGDPLLGFHQRSDQIEQFLLERRLWEHFPVEVAALGEAFTTAAAIILAEALELVGLPAELRELATGGSLTKQGSYHLTFNHYRDALPGVGLSSHKDDGFVTLLRVVRPGLEVNRRDRWETVPVSPDHLVVNFGLSMELLTARCPVAVSAIMHRVCHQDSDRWSYGHFTSSRCDPGSDGGIFAFAPPDQLEPICSSRDLIDANDAEIYRGTVPQETPND